VIDRFLLTWACHLGAYAGILTGLATATLRALGARR